MPNKDPAKELEYQRLYRLRNKAKTSLYNKTYYRRNETEVKQRNALWREQNKTYTTAYNASYRRTHKPEMKAYNDKWRKSNPEYLRLNSMRRRALKRKAPGTCTQEQLRWRVEMYGGMCWLGLPGCTGAATTIDHVIPLSRGGTNWPSNLRPACRHCNCSKGARK